MVGQRLTWLSRLGTSVARCASMPVRWTSGARSGVATTEGATDAAPFLPRSVTYPHPYRKNELCWLETLKTPEQRKLGMFELHPEVFATFPRLDILFLNVKWQTLYRKVNYLNPPNRMERSGGGRKPWPQKRMGRARHGSNRSPLFANGGICKPPRGPRSYFYMLPFYQRLLGLRVALTVKFAQDLLHVVDDLEIASGDPKALRSVVEARGWGLSVLFVDNTDRMPSNISAAVAQIPEYTLMPAYGLNVYSLLKHECVVLTRSALDHIEGRLLFWMNSTQRQQRFEPPYPAATYDGRFVTNWFDVHSAGPPTDSLSDVFDQTLRLDKH